MKTKLPLHTNTAPTHQAGAHDQAAPARQAHHPSAIDTSARMLAQRKVMEASFGATAQRATPEDEELQLKAAPPAVAGPDAVQRVGLEDDEPMQGQFASGTPAQLETGAQPNLTGMADNLKSGIENMSGMAMDHVRVHYNSPQPAQLNALAYAQGSDIHVAPGQEQHLPHEAWHVVQQAQGRVKPTMQLKEGVPVNDDAGLEHEADVMGAKALQMVSNISPGLKKKARMTEPVGVAQGRAPATVQGYKLTGAKDGGNFVGEKAACHCHIDIGKPHFKVGKDEGTRINFGNDMALARMQRAYDELLSQHVGKAGYDDCKEYLEEQGCSEEAMQPATETLKEMLIEWGGLADDKILYYEDSGRTVEVPIYDA